MPQGNVIDPAKGRNVPEMKAKPGCCRSGRACRHLPCGTEDIEAHQSSPVARRRAIRVSAVFLWWISLPCRIYFVTTRAMAGSGRSRLGAVLMNADMSAIDYGLQGRGCPDGDRFHPHAYSQSPATSKCQECLWVSGHARFHERTNIPTDKN